MNNDLVRYRNTGKVEPDSANTCKSPCKSSAQLDVKDSILLQPIKSNTFNFYEAVIKANSLLRSEYDCDPADSDDDIEDNIEDDSDDDSDDDSGTDYRREMPYKTSDRLSMVSSGALFKDLKVSGNFPKISTFFLLQSKKSTIYMYMYIYMNI